MIKVTVYHSPVKQGTRSSDSRPWHVLAFNGTFAVTTHHETEDEALIQKAQIEEANV